MKLTLISALVFASFVGSLSALAVDEEKPEVAFQPVNNLRQANGESNPESVSRRCIKCHSVGLESPCLSNPESSEITETCESTDSGCYLLTSSKSDVTRGCVGDNSVDGLEDCANPDECVHCSNEDKCNKQPIVIEQCYAVQHEINSPAEKITLEKVDCPIAAKPLGCYNWKEVGTITKGCVSDLVERRRKQCRKSEDCTICEGSLCNESEKPASLECYECDGKSDSDCVRFTNKIAKCEDPNLGCIVGIDAEGYTQRRCASNNITNFEPSHVCHENHCNNQTLPANRLECYQCGNSTECDQLAPNSTQNLLPQLCQTYAEPFMCFSYLSDENQTYRGCLSDDLKSAALCKDTPSRCQICETKGCNNIEITNILDNATDPATQSPPTNPSGAATVHMSSLFIVFGALIAFFCKL